MIRNILFGGANDTTGPVEFSLTALRVAAGASMAWLHGFQKLPPPEGLVKMVGDMGFSNPQLWAWAASLAESAGCVMIAIGLMTRWMSAVMVFNMAVIIFMAHKGAELSKIELPILYLVLFAASTVTGAGRISVDALLRDKAGRGVAT